MPGLAYPNALNVDDLDVLVHRPLPHSHIRALTAAQFARLHLAHACLDTPDSALFPFLHGIEHGNDQQVAFFQKCSAVPDYRGLVWVLATDAESSLHPPAHDQGPDSPDDDFYDSEDPDEDIGAHRDTVDSGENVDELYANDLPNGYLHLHRGSVSSSISSSSSGSSNSHSDSWTSSTTDTSLPESIALSSSSCSSHNPANLLSSTFLPSELLSISSTGPIFSPPQVPDGVSLRNFGIQLPVYATLSDIVVYSPSGATKTAIAVAERFKQAVEAKYFERCKTQPADAPALLVYNVFVVTEPFTTFESQFSPLVSVNSNGQPTKSYPDLAAKEKEEMRLLTSATEILPGVFLGNAADVPMWHKDDSQDPCNGANNPDSYDICVECQDIMPFPQSPHFRQAEEHVSTLESLWATGFITAGCPGIAHNSNTAPPRPSPNANAVVHLSCPSSPMSTQANLAQLLALVDFVIRASRGALLSGRRPLRVLVHSADGYTDSSVLALCLIMGAKHCSLPEAYLELQVARNRSFFVYPQDLPLLKRVESKLVPPTFIAEQQRKREREKSRESEKSERSRDRWGWTFSRSSSSASISILQSSTSDPESSPLFPQLSSSAPSTPTPIANNANIPRRTRASTTAGPLVANHHSWFNDPRFDGSFPSRVLPFLYLGNLNHASNAYMLHALGITHVVSVGECALVPPPAAGSCSPRACGTTHPQGSLWIEEREGRIKVLDIKGVCDDGIDSLRSQFAPICDWIDKARLEGGKVLIHCRVGVSRSATVTIAYVMKHLNLPLVDSYLIVRSRRLSVLIQPNMRLLYNLCGWEVELAHQRVQSELSSRRPSPALPPSIERTLDADTLVAETATKTVYLAPLQTSMAPADLDARLANEEYANRLRYHISRKLTWPFLAREVHLLNEKYLS